MISHKQLASKYNLNKWIELWKKYIRSKICLCDSSHQFSFEVNKKNTNLQIKKFCLSPNHNVLVNRLEIMGIYCYYYFTSITPLFEMVWLSRTEMKKRSLWLRLVNVVGSDVAFTIKLVNASILSSAICLSRDCFLWVTKDRF